MPITYKFSKVSFILKWNKNILTKRTSLDMGGSDSHKIKQHKLLDGEFIFKCLKGGIWYLIKNQINK